MPSLAISMIRLQRPSVHSRLFWLKAYDMRVRLRAHMAHCPQPRLLPMPERDSRLLSASLRVSCRHCATNQGGQQDASRSGGPSVSRRRDNHQRFEHAQLIRGDQSPLARSEAARHAPDGRRVDDFAVCHSVIHFIPVPV